MGIRSEPRTLPSLWPRPYQLLVCNKVFNYLYRSMEVSPTPSSRSSSSSASALRVPLQHHDGDGGGRSRRGQHAVRDGPSALAARLFVHGPILLLARRAAVAGLLKDFSIYHDLVRQSNAHTHTHETRVGTVQSSPPSPQALNWDWTSVPAILQDLSPQSLSIPPSPYSQS